MILPPPSTELGALLRPPLRALAAARRLAARHLALPPLRVTARTLDGIAMRLDLNELVEASIVRHGDWEPCISAYIRRTVGAGDVVIDIGANVGFYSLLAAKLAGPSGRIYAIEPSPAIFADLTANVALQRGGAPIHCIEAAVAAAPATLRLFSERGGNRGRSRLSGGGAQFDEGTPVRAAPLADLMPETDVLRARLIKIDVEGAETDVVRGIAALIPRLSPRIVLIVETLIDGPWRDHPPLVPFLAAGFSAAILPNGYDAAFYRNPPPPDPVPLGDEVHTVVDVLLRRA
ncbi:MAG: FkbM family methyltransferase [Sphingomonadaceae bacterium]|nr:FkbM family methyltransferase [Sphingomonadaceae bacterium]